MLNGHGPTAVVCQPGAKPWTLADFSSSGEPKAQLLMMEMLGMREPNRHPSQVPSQESPQLARIKSE